MKEGLSITFQALRLSGCVQRMKKSMLLSQQQQNQSLLYPLPLFWGSSPKLTGKIVQHSSVIRFLVLKNTANLAKKEKDRK